MKFIKSKSFPGILLGLSALLGMMCVNSFLSDTYDLLITTPVSIHIAQLSIDKPLLLWINDGLMAIFFLLVGLEIKREFLEGHLSSLRQSVAPIVCAIAGFLGPALIYSFLNWGDPHAMRGWAIPAATDIAFALGVAILLGDRVPAALRVTLVAIAIIDDLLAILVIAIFYTESISSYSLFWGSIGISAALLLNCLHVRNIGAYCLIGIFIWGCVLKSGVHATLAGVLLGFIIPFKTNGSEGSPLKTMEKALYPWVSFFIVPLFAFTNSGIDFSIIKIDSILNPLPLGITLGLFFGAHGGVMGAMLLLKFFGIASLPENTTWKQFYGMAILTGVGFTMSLFIGTMAYEDLDTINAVRLGVMAGSCLSAIAGCLVLYFSKIPETIKDYSMGKI